jgi:hypothetical protein
VPVKGLHGTPFDETNFLVLEIISVNYEDGRKRKPASIASIDQQWSIKLRLCTR